MTISTPSERIEPAEHSKLVNERKTADIRKYNIERIEYSAKNEGSLKAVKRRLGVGKGQMYALKNNPGNVITNRDKIVTVAEEIYRDLYSSRDIQDMPERGSISQDIDFPLAPIEEVRKASKEIKGGKAPGAGQITADLMKDGGEIVPEKLAKFICNA